MNQSTRVRRAYTSTVVGWAPLALVLLVAVAVAAVLLAVDATWWVPTATVVVLLLVGLQASVVRLSIGGGVLTARMGSFVRHRVPVSAIEETTVRDLRLREVFGIGLPLHAWSVKMAVRPGPTLLLRSGRTWLRISTAHPEDAIDTIGTIAAGRAGSDAAGSNQASWFGPKRVGVGIRPQTWQGWAVTLGGVLVVIAAVLLISVLAH